MTTPHPARPVPQGADPQLAGMLGPLLDYLTEPDAESAPKPNGSPPSVSADHRPSCQSGAVTTTTTTCGEITAELVDIDAITRDVFGADVPLRDRVATLVADWRDTSAILAGGHVDTFSAGDIDLRQRDRRGLA